MLETLKKLLGFGPKVDVKNLLKEGAQLIDVRTPAEFKAGHVKGATNIPLDKLQGQISKIKANNKPVVTCCASGMRSGQGAGILRRAGIQAYNGGSWTRLT